MKLSKTQWILLGITVVFFVFTMAFFLGRSSVHEVVATERVPVEVSVPEEATKALEPELRVELNTATKSELEELPGIGEVLAERIIAFREENGCFVSTEQLMDVEGIGSVKYEKVKDLIYVEAVQ